MSIEEQLVIFESDLSRETDDFINKTFKISYSLKEPLFHYTRSSSLAAITGQQKFWASMIRSTSDPLEFALPLASARDWTCIDKKFFDFKKFPIELFKHFNEQAKDPAPRPYFVSFSRLSNLDHLKRMYGEAVVKIEALEKNDDFRNYGYWIECEYLTDTKAKVFEILNRWKEEVFSRVAKNIGIKNPDSPDVVDKWLYIFMKICLTIPLALKQSSFSEEKEIRLVVYPRGPDENNEHWRGPRAFREQSLCAKTYREYVPLNLEKMKIRASAHLQTPSR